MRTERAMREKENELEQSRGLLERNWRTCDAFKVDKAIIILGSM